VRMGADSAAPVRTCRKIVGMSSSEHRRDAPASVTVHVITVSDTRTIDTDRSGAAIAGLLETSGHVVHGRTILRDEPAEVRTRILELAAGGVDAVITTGGTGITARDGTFEAVDGLLTKRLPGFGEIFRMISYQQIGAAAMLSRATAGLVDRTVVIALPGSENAVRLAMDELVVPELGHLVREARR
jgi:molybdenum cofactor biosynthesis protein B